MINIKEKIAYNAFEKQAHVYPHLDDFIVGQDYAFTVNPRFQMASFTETYIAHMAHFEMLKSLCQFDMRPEISTKSTRLHYHGRIRFMKSTSLVAFYYHMIPKLKDVCTFTIKPIDDWQWYIYCTKARHLMKPYMQSIGLTYRITNHTVGKLNPDKPLKRVKKTHELDDGIRWQK